MLRSISGIVSSSKQTDRTDCQLVWDENGGISIDAISLQFDDVRQLTISPRVGNTLRYIDFPDGGGFETKDNQAIDLMVKTLEYRHSQGFLAVLESSKRFIFLSLISSVALVYIFVQYGIPALARPLSQAVPITVSESLGDMVIDALDDYGMRESQLSAARQQKLATLFEQHLVVENYPLTPHLDFRQGGFLGANAIAIPNGTLIVTDELVELAENDEQILAILGHELGHIYHLHSIRMAIEQFGLAIMVMSFTGDVSASSGALVSAPAILAATRYSRDLEREADDFALEKLREWEIPPHHFVNIMRRLEASVGEAYDNCLDENTDNSDKETETGENIEEKSDNISDELRETCLTQAIGKQGDDTDGSVIESYLSTHPLTGDRIEKFLEN